MDENNNKRINATAREAITGILFIFLILILFLYQFGTNKKTISNLELTEDAQGSKENFLNQLEEENGENDTFNKYLKQIYELQSSSTLHNESHNSSENNREIESIINEYQKELQEKIRIPTQSFQLQNISDTYSPKIYRDNFEILYAELKSNKENSESKIFSSQIIDDGTLLPLAEFDKETILRIASDYEIFADKLSLLPTPKSLEKRMTELGTSALNVSFILRKMVAEDDSKIYSLWISKYAENMSVIITIRYALQ